MNEAQKKGLRNSILSRQKPRQLPFRPMQDARKKERLRQITVSISAENLKEIDHFREDLGTTRTNFIRRAIQVYIENLRSLSE